MSLRDTLTNDINIKRHVFFWGLILVYYCVSTNIKAELWLLSIYIVLFILSLCFGYYSLILFVFPKYFGKKKLMFLLFITLTFFIFASIDYFLFYKVLIKFGGISGRSKKSFLLFFRKSTFYYGFITFAAIGTYINMKSKKRIKEIHKEEKEILQLKLSFLKNQFHSHLTFNFFNYCYSNTFHQSVETAKNIESFIEVLHYSLKYRQNELSPIKKEIEYFENVILIHKCIMPNNFINIGVSGDNRTVKIYPMLIPAIAEYILSTEVMEISNGYTIFHIDVTENILLFKARKNNVLSLDNFDANFKQFFKILDYLYPENYNYNTSNTNNELTINLTLNLN